jgi:hypothetical protein
MTGSPPEVWPTGPVPNWSIPNPITINCTGCGTAFITDANSPAARDRLCLICYFGPSLEDVP